MSSGCPASCQFHDSGNGAGTLRGDPSSLPAEYPRKSLNGVPRQNPYTNHSRARSTQRREPGRCSGACTEVPRLGGRPVVAKVSGDRPGPQAQPAGRRGNSPG